MKINAANFLFCINLMLGSYALLASEKDIEDYEYEQASCENYEHCSDNIYKYIKNATAYSKPIIAGLFYSCILSVMAGDNPTASPTESENLHTFGKIFGATGLALTVLTVCSICACRNKKTGSKTRFCF